MTASGAVKPPPAEDVRATTSDDFVVYGTAAWDSPWLTDQNLAHALARSHRVLYVEPTITPLSPLRYGLRHGSVRAGLRRLAAPALSRRDRVHVLRPLAVPPKEQALAARVSTPLVRREIRRAAERLGFERPVVVAAHSALNWAGAAGERGTVYLAKDLVEAGAALLGKDPARLGSDQLRMCEQADLVCAVTRPLQETLRARGVQSELLPHGFHAELAASYDASEAPADLARLPSPVLGYTGRIDGRLDFGALERLADRFPDGSLALIGPVSPRLPREQIDRLASRPNVHLLGERPREEMPAYVSALDCCLLPYRDDEWLRHGSPLKLWDYLYAGAPVVGSGCAVLQDYRLVRYASPPDRLADLVAATLDAPDGERDERRAYALANSWDTRADQLTRLVDERLPQRQTAAVQL